MDVYPGRNGVHQVGRTGPGRDELHHGRCVTVLPLLQKLS